VEKAAAPSLAVAGPTWQDPGRRPGLTRAEMEYFRGRVYSAIRPIATRIAGQPVRVGMRTTRSGTRAKKFAPGFVRSAPGGLRLLDDHEFLRAVRRPNPYMVGWSLVYSTVAMLELTGLCYWWVEESDDGLMIWPLPPSWVIPNDSEDGQVLFESYTVRPYNSGLTFDLPGRDVLRLYYPSPENPIRGCFSPLMAAALSVSADESILTAQAKAFMNDANPGLALIVGRHPDVQGVPGERPLLTKEQRSQLVNAVRQQYAGAARHGEPLILDGLIQDVKRVNTTVREMDFSESGNLTRDRIDQAFGTNPIVMGLIQDANRASAAVADELFCSATLNPKIELLSQLLTAFATERYDERLVVFIEPARPIDPDGARADRDQLMKAGCLRKNELRSAHNLPPLSAGEGGEELIQPPSAGNTLANPDGGGAAFGSGPFRAVG
jgi:HK97 family phage portal protein